MCQIALVVNPTIGKSNPKQLWTCNLIVSLNNYKSLTAPSPINKDAASSVTVDIMAEVTKA